MVYTLFLSLTILYLFSIVGVEVITNHPLARGPAAEEEFAKVVEEHFDSLPTTMLTLVGFVTLDSVAPIYKPLIKGDWRLAFYFMGIVLSISIVLMNLITAVIVNSALEQASSDRETQSMQETKRKKKIVEELRAMFNRMDHDGSGGITLTEIQEAAEDDINLLKRFMTLENTGEVFKMLDLDSSGHLNIDEFCDGILEHVLSDRSIDFKRIEKEFKRVRTQLRETNALILAVAAKPQKHAATKPDARLVTSVTGSTLSFASER
eukprot:TRINITY_DN22719_c0_g2_i1.p1 TRINITY_DN22719_c0_g2~~TRINITY_DN22719_c0_g2_i1.p1  ORF type:complete len:286 (-),score=39.49 TRINITY_DN22719_c0_g2_i1:55-846(-)